MPMGYHVSDFGYTTNDSSVVLSIWPIYRINKLQYSFSPVLLFWGEDKMQTDCHPPPLPHPPPPPSPPPIEIHHLKLTPLTNYRESLACLYYSSFNLHAQGWDSDRPIRNLSMSPSSCPGTGDLIDMIERGASAVSFT